MSSPGCPSAVPAADWRAMPYALLADLVVVAHLAFIVFAVAGGLLVLHSRQWMWVHVPAALWATLVELAGWPCPLTPLENWLRAQAGAAVYGSGFVERYLVSLIYPADLTRGLQIALGTLVLVINGAVYAWAVRRARR